MTRDPDVVREEMEAEQDADDPSSPPTTRNGEADVTAAQGLTVATHTDDTNTYWVGNAAEETAYRVDLGELDGDGETRPCECPDQKYRQDPEEYGVCKHVLAALEAHPDTVTVERLTATMLREEIGLLQSATDSLLQAATAEAAENGTPTPSDVEAGESGAQGGADDTGGGTPDDDTDGLVTEADPSADDVQLMTDLREWFEKAAEFNGFDADVVDLNWVTADGVEGIHVDRAPFEGGYYDDGEWQDRDGFDAEKEAIKDSVLSSRDEFEWYGEPDYVWFIAAEDISEVLG